MDEVVHTFTDLTNAATVGRSLEQPSSHFVRLLRLLSADQRRHLVADGQKLYESVYAGSYTQQQFVAHALFSTLIGDDELSIDPDQDPFLAIISSEHNRARFMQVVESVQLLVTSSSLTTLDEVNGALRQKLDFPSKFRFLESPYGVIVPVRECQRISRDFTDLVERVSVNKTDLLQLSPRQFEVFIGDLFRGLGYSVELTKATRDGGADLLCLKNEHGIPFRVAVEVKRYKEGRPITVSEPIGRGEIGVVYFRIVVSLVSPFQRGSPGTICINSADELV